MKTAVGKVSDVPLGHGRENMKKRPAACEALASVKEPASRQNDKPIRRRDASKRLNQQQNCV